MSRIRWRKDVTPDGVVTHTDPSGRVVIEKHTHHYGPWLVKDLALDERVGETEVSEAQAKRLAEDYLDRPRAVPGAPTAEPAATASSASPPETAAPGHAGTSDLAPGLLAVALELRAVAARVEALAKAPGGHGAGTVASVVADVAGVLAGPVARLAAGPRR
ncbi:hypothetical protein CLV35_1530 [Motilibacter peucedani]|uniref:Uncharacterized protein n=1 Tax=Motilibacter peucedani TaxID=598650 RepID=A0A420XSG2_9ACTN|nr:hypothetical protein [Motilibacter peucedani]RKS77832.1 hypothetical protein CLV35_1530 [Motilibacter peucedani]